MSVSARLDTTLVIAQKPHPTAPVVSTDSRFPVRRIFCVGRNYAEHAKEMGFTGREPPFFFMKYPEAVLSAAEGEKAQMAYPPLTTDLQHEVELVVAIREGGINIDAADALEHVFGYAVGLDMTRRDLQGEMKKQGRPWEIGKAFEQSAPLGPILPAELAGNIATAEITLNVNDNLRQNGNIGQMIWSIPEIIAEISTAWGLYAGDLIYTGTPEGVGAVTRGDLLSARVTGLPPLLVEII